MKFRQFRNENGITLVELLAALGLFAVVIALASTVMMQLANSEEKTSNAIALQQNTNVLINELRNQYTQKSMKTEESTTEFDLNYNQIGGLEITEVVINNGKKSEEELIIDKGIIKNIKKQETLPIKITTANDAGERFTVETAWSVKKDTVLMLTKEHSEFDEKQDFEDMIDEHDFVPGKTLIGDNENKCQFDTNTKIEQDVMNSYTACENTVINENAWFPGNLTMNNTVNLQIDKNLYAESFFLLHNQAKIHAKGGARINGELKATGSNEIIIDGHFFSEDNVILYNAASVAVGKNGTFEDEIELQSSTSLTVAGDAHFEGPVNLHSNAAIIIKGNAAFDGPVGYDWSSGKICVQGDASFSQTVGPNLEIQEGTENCD